MWKLIEAFGSDETATAAIEYAFIAGLVSIMSLVYWRSMGDTMQTLYGSLANDLPDGA